MLGHYDAQVQEVEERLERSKGRSSLPTLRTDIQIVVEAYNGLRAEHASVCQELDATTEEACLMGPAYRIALRANKLLLQAGLDTALAAESVFDAEGVAANQATSRIAVLENRISKLTSEVNQSRSEIVQLLAENQSLRKDKQNLFRDYEDLREERREQHNEIERLRSQLTLVTATKGI